MRRWSWPGSGGKPVYNFRSEGRRFEAGRDSATGAPGEGFGRCLIPLDAFFEFTDPGTVAAETPLSPPIARAMGPSLSPAGRGGRSAGSFPRGRSAPPDKSAQGQVALRRRRRRAAGRRRAVAARGRAADGERRRGRGTARRRGVHHADLRPRPRHRAVPQPPDRPAAAGPLGRLAGGRRAGGAGGRADRADAGGDAGGHAGALGGRGAGAAGNRLPRHDVRAMF